MYCSKWVIWICGMANHRDLISGSTTLVQIQKQSEQDKGATVRGIAVEVAELGAFLLPVPIACRTDSSASSIFCKKESADVCARDSWTVVILWSMLSMRCAALLSSTWIAPVTGRERREKTWGRGNYNNNTNKIPFLVASIRTTWSVSSFSLASSSCLNCANLSRTSFWAVSAFVFSLACCFCCSEKKKKEKLENSNAR